MDRASISAGLLLSKRLSVCLQKKANIILTRTLVSDTSTVQGNHHMAPTPSPPRKGRSITELFDCFRNEFSFKLPCNEQEKRRAFHLRHDVYCAELHYEPPTDAERQLEYDVFDDHAIHCVVEHNQTGLTVGCMRVVLPRFGCDLSGRKLPLLTYGGQSLTHPSLHPDSFPRENICEVSRLAVHPSFRKARSNIAGVKEKDIHDLEAKHRSLPVGLSLFFAATAIVGMAKRQHVFAMMEPRFARLLKISGLSFQQVGDLIDYHGPRAAFYIDQRQAETAMHEELKPLYRHIKQQLSPQLAAAMPHRRRCAATTS
ncbi:hypothetical protein CR157_05860 [Halomonas sp. LBP4]|nr:hypothetical protein CR157_05860 [Halomonas sp. LBP4]